MKQPIIGITGNICDNRTDDTAPRLSYVVTNFVTAVQEAGGLPLILPIGSPEDAKTYLYCIDKLILTGGQHVSPQFYQEEKTIESQDYSLERDRFELALIQEALAQKKPIFSVCRGTQLFNVAMGGSLYQDIPHHWQDGPAATSSHAIKIEPETVLSLIYGQEADINSFHHQSIKKLGQGLKVLAHSPADGIIEAITTLDGSPYLGVQWHPELLFATQESDQKLFHYVVQEL